MVRFHMGLLQLFVQVEIERVEMTGAGIHPFACVRMRW